MVSRRLFGFVWVVLGGCFSPSDGAGGADAGLRDAGAGQGGSGGAGHGGSGGAAHDGGAHAPDAHTRVDAGAALDAGTPAVCLLPVETGPCDGAFVRWGWRSSVGACERFSYGGCEGNANNFESPGECLSTCAPAPDRGPVGAPACLVGGLAFPSGAHGIDDPFSCNTCTCFEGQLACTEIHCPEDCPPNRKPETSCAQCGPADGCEVLEHGCLLVCSEDSDCAGTTAPDCFNGLCMNVCG